MRDDMTLYQSDTSIIEKETKSIAKLMDEEEQQWFQSQKEIKKLKLAEKQAKIYHLKQRAVVLLETCKLHNGPFASVEEIKSTLKTIKADRSKSRCYAINFYSVN